jgi:hypothetical protein
LVAENATLNADESKNLGWAGNERIASGAGSRLRSGPKGGLRNSACGQGRLQAIKGRYFRSAKVVARKGNRICTRSGRRPLGSAFWFGASTRPLLRLIHPINHPRADGAREKRDLELRNSVIFALALVET